MNSKSAPLSFSDARDVLKQSLPQCETISLPVDDAYQSFLAENITAPFPFPRYTNSAMDGFALRAEDTTDATPEQPVKLRITSTIAAGYAPEKDIASGTCAAIMTGGILPENANAVVKIEDVTASEDEITVCMPLHVGENIRCAGDEVQEGDILLRKNTQITPPVTGVLSSIHRDTVSVYKKPRVAVLTTGDEICESGKQLLPGKMYDAAGPALLSALAHDTFCCVHFTHVRDSREEITQAIETAAEKAECILIIGGASMGKYDYVQSACKKCHIEELFWKVAVKPGKPLWVGVRVNVRVFNLPGNPVSVLVSYCLFVRWYLLQWAGCSGEKAELVTHQAILTDEIMKNDPRREFIRGTYHVENEELYVSPLKERRSDMLSGMAKADCLIHVPENISQIKAGEKILTLHLPWKN